MSTRQIIKRVAVGLVFVLTLSLLAGCGGTNSQVAEKGEKVLFETVKQGHNGFGFKQDDRPEFKVFREEAEWNKFWNRATTMTLVGLDYADPMVPGQPFVDPDPRSDQLSKIAWSAVFTEYEMVIGAFIYQTASYEISVTDIRKLRNKLLVTVTGEAEDDNKPGMTAPYHIVKLKKYDLPVEFKFIDKR